MLRADEFALGCFCKGSTFRMPRAPALLACGATLTAVTPDEITSVPALPEEVWEQTKFQHKTSFGLG